MTLTASVSRGSGKTRGIWGGYQRQLRTLHLQVKADRDKPEKAEREMQETLSTEAMERLCYDEYAMKQATVTFAVLLEMLKKDMWERRTLPHFRANIARFARATEILDEAMRTGPRHHSTIDDSTAVKRDAVSAIDRLARAMKDESDGIPRDVNTCIAEANDSLLRVAAVNLLLSQQFLMIPGFVPSFANVQPFYDAFLLAQPACCLN
jgi:hypothetical protein